MEVLKTDAVDTFIENLTIVSEQRTQLMIAILEKRGPDLRMPDSRSLKKGLFELRILGNPQIRILYFFHKNSAILVHAFIKKSMRIPKKEIVHGRKVMKMLVQNI